MVSYEAAYRVALLNSHYYPHPAIISADRIPNGWIFEFEQPMDEDLGVPLPGGPNPVAVFENGQVQTINLPSDEGFALIDSIVERNLPLPEDDADAS